VAIYTELPIEDASRITRAHGLGPATEVEGVVAGSVNSNFVLTTGSGRAFARIYEEQDTDGVRYEHALLAHLVAAGVPVPRVIEGPAPGEPRVAGKPTALFELVGGDEVCQKMVTLDRMDAVGRFLASTHAAVESFPIRRGGRFTRADVRRRLEGVAALDRPELREAVEVLRETLDEVDAEWDPSVRSGVIHGDLFRDNVRWTDGDITCVLDWESAADGACVYDLAVTALAWCYGDELERPLIDALLAGYESVRPLTDAEQAALPLAMQAAAARFTVTRITDFHLREDAVQVKKDWRRFYARLLAVR